MTHWEGEPCTKVAARLALDLLRCKMGNGYCHPKHVMLNLFRHPCLNLSLIEDSGMDPETSSG